MIIDHLRLEFHVKHSPKIPNSDHAEDNSEDTPQDTFDETSLHND